MIEPYRSEFNARFTQAKYAELQRVMNERTRTNIQFRLAETPCFFPAPLMDRMVRAGIELTTQLLGNIHYINESNVSIPDAFCVPNQDKHPHFMTVDFGLVRDADGELQPRLVEMQAFPSVFGHQAELSKAYIEVFGLDQKIDYFLSGLDEAGYWALLREVIVGRHDPENVVLMELAPEQQKTLPDFRVHEDRLGIAVVDVQKLVKQGNKLHYRNAKSGQLVPIHRIYNRVIVDEVVREGLDLPFDYRDELDVEWAGHPNWYFRISKFSIPHLDHPTVPASALLDDWYAGIGRDCLPEDRASLILKPLYSFAGKGIKFGPSDGDLAGIAPKDRRNYLLQERMHFEPVIQTPEGPTQAEIRLLYVWPDEKPMIPVIALTRMGRGLMMGVDHNRDRTWVGGSSALRELP